MNIFMYRVRLKSWMFQPATEKFKLMEMNGNAPVPPVYTNMALYFLPIRRTRKCSFGVLVFTKESAGRLLGFTTHDPSCVSESFYTHYCGRIFSNDMCWAGLIPFSAFTYQREITSELEPVLPEEPLFPKLRDSLELGATSSSSRNDETVAPTPCKVIFSVFPNKTGSDYKFTVRIDCKDQDFTEHVLNEMAGRYPIYIGKERISAAFASIGDYEAVRTDYSDPKTEWFYNGTFRITYTWDVPNNFSLEGVMTYLEEELRDFDWDFDWKTVPFSYQEDAIAYGLSHDRFLLCDSQGLGKTLESSTIAAVRKQQLGYEHCLIICCVNTLKWNWVNEVRLHTYEDAHVLGSYTKKDGTIGYQTKKRLSDLDQIDELPYFLVTNIEFLRDSEAVKKLESLIEKKKINMIIADEVHKCKNPKAAQTKGFLKLLPECRIAMTGTPIMNNPIDVFVYLKWLGFEKHSFTMFRNFYLDRDGKLRHLSILDQNMDCLMLRRTKEDVLDLPPKTYEEEIVELSMQHQKLYDTIRDEAKDAVDQLEEGQNPLSLLLHLRQCTLDPSLLTDNPEDVSEKFERALDLIQTAMSNGESVVVFSSWKTPIYHFRDYLTENQIKCHTITGDTKDQERMDMVTAFQENPEPEVMLGTTGALGTGVTLTKATTVIFLDEPWTEAAKEQAVDRCYRIGTKKNVTVYTLMAKDTIDERVHELLFYKKNVALAIIDKKTEARFLLGGNGLLSPEEMNQEETDQEAV